MKAAFCPGLGLELYQFCWEPLGLSGAPSSFQRLMDKVLHCLSFATTYVDDILVHSASEEEHKDHLRQVFQRLREAGLTLKGNKCHIGKTQVSYLGRVFSGTGMVPGPQKVQTVKDWPIPTSVTDVRQFLGLASYYWRYISRFADIAALLHDLTRKGVSFAWTPECSEAFDTLKDSLLHAPVLGYP